MNGKASELYSWGPPKLKNELHLLQNSSEIVLVWPQENYQFFSRENVSLKPDFPLKPTIQNGPQAKSAFEALMRSIYLVRGTHELLSNYIGVQEKQIWHEVNF